MKYLITLLNYPFTLSFKLFSFHKENSLSLSSLTSPPSKRNIHRRARKGKEEKSPPRYNTLQQYPTIKISDKYQTQSQWQKQIDKPPPSISPSRKRKKPHLSSPSIKLPSPVLSLIHPLRSKLTPPPPLQKRTSSPNRHTESYLPSPLTTPPLPPAHKHPLVKPPSSPFHPNLPPPHATPHPSAPKPGGARSCVHSPRFLSRFLPRREPWQRAGRRRRQTRAATFCSARRGSVAVGVPAANRSRPDTERAWNCARRRA